MYEIDGPPPPPSPRATYHLYKYLWTAGRREEALTHLSEFADTMLAAHHSGQHDIDVPLLVHALLKVGDWKLAQASEDTTTTTLEEVLDLHEKAKDCSSTYEGWGGGCGGAWWLPTHDRPL